MMTKFLAIIASMGLVYLNQIAYLWFTFGLWPVAWWGLLVFGLFGTVITHTVMARILKDVESK